MPLFEMPARLGRTLHDQLLTDFGIDLPIEDGSGQTDDPVIITATAPEDVGRAAELTISLVHRGLGLAIGAEVFWQVIERAASDPTSGLLSYRLSRMTLSATEAVSELVKYTFRVRSGILTDVPPVHIVHQDEALGTQYPFNVGGLEYVKYYDYEIEEPGQGYSVGYSGPQVTATIYGFVGQSARDDAGHRIDAELSTSMTGIEARLGQIDDARPFTCGSPFGQLARGIDVGLDARRRTLVLVDNKDDHLLKWRVTWRDDERRAVVMDFLRKSRELFEAHRPHAIGHA